jgi:hypothetical protein
MGIEDYSELITLMAVEQATWWRQQFMRDKITISGRAQLLINTLADPLLGAAQGGAFALAHGMSPEEPALFVPTIIKYTYLVGRGIIKPELPPTLSSVWWNLLAASHMPEKFMYKTFVSQNIPLFLH